MRTEILSMNEEGNIMVGKFIIEESNPWGFELKE
jgi:hypothetical protein